VKKYIYLLISNISLFIVFPLIRLISKSFYEKKILPYVLNLTCNSRPIDYQRKKVIPEASGKVLEIGIGPGSNLKHYDNQKVISILGIDPSEELNQIAVKQLKNRYNDPTVNKRFVVGIDRAKMRLYDVKNNQQDIVDSGQDDFAQPVFDKTDFGQDWKV